ncbi:MAG: 2,5-didehydrogluconate reductase [Chloroflexi bacterium GWB2_49_20]|nr:MAG: 2,5-didehydrogluconate reductase [Chloroflexi bacterium GWB2_49_20]OGN78259.1 MAG: 2,5-didehydrogluconate reductase [Chloroflexi bacterium GWC2_49_37]OGN85295.1 MAG: 2,5-didehydrogluconate reductase [Chloroflexi bacterium GWD2_49_16]
MTENTTAKSPSLDNLEIGVGAWAWGDRFFWNYGGSFNDQDIEAAFRTSLDAGINFIDTAEVYGQGRSEQILGQLMQNTNKPVLVATKFFPYPWRLARRSLQNALDHSLKRLQVDQVFLYQIHWPLLLLPIGTLMDAMADAVKSGKITAVGVSNFSKSQTQRAYTALARHNIPLASNQVEYHLLNRQIEKNGLLARCRAMGVRVIAYSPLAQGLLTGKYSPESPPPGVRGPRYASLLKNIQPLIALMKEIGKGQGDKTPGQVALNWLICKGALPIPGAKNLAQIQQNNGSIGWRLTEDEIAALDAASDEVAK